MCFSPEHLPPGVEVGFSAELLLEVERLHSSTLRQRLLKAEHDRDRYARRIDTLQTELAEARKLCHDLMDEMNDLHDLYSGRE